MRYSRKIESKYTTGSAIHPTGSDNNFYLTIFSFNKHLNSPYAKTSNWGIAELKRDIAEKKRLLAISTAKEIKENFQIFVLKFLCLDSKLIFGLKN